MAQSSLWSSTAGVSVRAQGCSRCVLHKALQQLAEQTALLCCHIIQTRDTDSSEAICLRLLVFIERRWFPSPSAGLLKLREFLYYSQCFGWFSEEVTHTLVGDWKSTTPLHCSFFPSLHPSVVVVWVYPSVHPSFAHQPSASQHRLGQRGCAATCHPQPAAAWRAAESLSMRLSVAEQQEGWQERICAVLCT